MREEEKKFKYTIAFGCLSPPVHIQLRQHKPPKNSGRHHLQLDVDAVNRLFVSGILSNSETKRARLRLIKRINTLYGGAKNLCG